MTTIVSKKRNEFVEEHGTILDQQKENPDNQSEKPSHLLLNQILNREQEVRTKLEARKRSATYDQKMTTKFVVWDGMKHKE